MDQRGGGDDKGPGDTSDARWELGWARGSWMHEKSQLIHDYKAFYFRNKHFLSLVRLFSHLTDVVSIHVEVYADF